MVSQRKQLDETNQLLISTRLRPPVLDANLVARPRLLTKISKTKSAGKLIVFSAPAGYGKSLLMSQCFESYAEAGWSVAWLSLEEIDNNRAIFSKYLIRMVEKLLGVNPGEFQFGNKTLAVKLVSTIYDLVEKSGKRCVLFFDDFHTIVDESLLEFFQQLVTHLPQSLNVVIGSRTSLPIPLAKLNTKGQLVSIGIDDLKFDQDETSRLYLHSNQLEIDQAQMEMLYEHTGGWVVVLQLAAISLKSAKDKNAFVRQFSSADKPVSEFLNEEFMATLDTSVADFLRQISIADRVCRELCVAISGDDNLSLRLEGLSSLGCLVQSLGASGRWFRVHPIVRDYLVAQLELLNPVEKEGYHRKAASWFESEGLIGEAIQHALSGNDEEHALELIEQGGAHLINTGYLEHLLSLVRRLPDQVVENSLAVLEQLAWLEVLNANISQTNRILSQMKQVLRKRGTNDLTKWLQAVEIEAAIYLYDENYEEGKKFVAEWLPQVPETSVRVIASLKQVDSYIKISQFDFDPVRENARWVLNQPISLQIDLTQSFAACVLSLVYYHQGLLIRSQKSLDAYLKELNQRVGGTSQVIIVVESMLAAILYQLGELELAVDVLEKYSKTHHQLVPAEHLLVLMPVRARLLFTSGDHQSALDYLSEMQLLAEEKGWLRLESSVLNEQVRIYLELGSINQAQLAYDIFVDKLENLSGKTTTQFVQARNCSEVTRARILSSEGRSLSAVKVIQAQLKAAMEQGRTLHVLELRVLLIRFHIACGDKAKADGMLVETLKSDPENSCVQVFRDEGESVMQYLRLRRLEIGDDSGGQAHLLWEEQIMRVLGERPDTPVAETASRVAKEHPATYQKMVETLTKRELQILRLLADGLSNKEISSNLGVSTNTIKTHLQACYGKLGVARRTQAVVRLRELGIFH